MGAPVSLLQLHRAAHMVDVGVGDDNLLHRQSMLLHDAENVVDLVAGIDDHGLFGLLVAQ